MSSNMMVTVLDFVSACFKIRGIMMKLNHPEIAPFALTGFISDTVWSSKLAKTTVRNQRIAELHPNAGRLSVLGCHIKLRWN